MARKAKLERVTKMVFNWLEKGTRPRQEQDEGRIVQWYTVRAVLPSRVWVAWTHAPLETGVCRSLKMIVIHKLSRAT